MSVPAKWSSLAPLLTREGPYVQEGFEGDPENISNLSETRVLVVGAGGLGCEILKDLALSGFTDIHVIDLDTIDVSNLNRQFLFRMKDVGEPKAKCAAEFVMKRVKGVTIKWYNKPIQEFAKAWYRKFDVVIAGLDNIAARSWLNETLVDLVKFDDDGDVDWDTLIPLVDGGTEGFAGQSRVFLPGVSSCFECHLQSLPEQTHFPSCTIRNVPRIPEHCIAYALKVSWNMLEELKSASDFKLYVPKDANDTHKPDGVKLDKDDVEHMSWLFNSALARAQHFKIEGVTYNLTMQVVKNIIPAIASTNALVSAACCNEVFKYLSGVSRRLNNYMMYMGGKQTGINCENFLYERRSDCSVCTPPLQFTVGPSETFSALMSKIEEKLGEVMTVTDQNQSLMVYTKNMKETDTMSKPVAGVVPDGSLLLVTAAKNTTGAKVYVRHS